MAMSINAAVIDLKQLDILAEKKSYIHVLDARAKVLVTLLFVVTVVSFDRYELAGLLPFMIFPVSIIALANLPSIYLLRKIALILPLVLVPGVFNLFFDLTTMYQVGQISISGGAVSLLSLFIRSTLTISAAFILVATTGFTAVCHALERLGTPQVFTVQLLFLHRYIFVLAEESERAAKARELRACGRKGLGIASFGSLTGHLLLRTWQRAERIHDAMSSRGFTGRFHTRRQSAFGIAELSFVLGWTLLLISLRFLDIEHCIGELLQ